MKTRKLFPLLFFALMFIVSPTSTVFGIDTTYQGATVSWSVAELGVINYNSVLGGSMFFYDSSQLSREGGQLTLSVTIPKQYFSVDVVGIATMVQIYAYNGKTASLVAEKNVVDPTKDLTFDQQLSYLMDKTTGYTAFSFHAFYLTGDADADVYSINIYVKLSDEVIFDISWNPDLKGDSEDNENAEITESEGPGEVVCQGLPRYSVNTAALNLLVTDTDVSYKGLGPEITMKRIWNADPSVLGMFGNGWSFSYESSLVTSCTGATLRKGSGQERLYTADLCPAPGPLTYPVSATPPEGDYDRLSLIAGDYWVLEKKGVRTKYQYNLFQGQEYRLSSITDRNGNAVQISYNVDGTIQGIADAAGRTTLFTYDGNKRCISMTTPDGRTATFAYDSSANLIQTVDLLGTVTTYQYDANNYLTALTVGDKTARFTYYSNGAIKHLATVTDANGNVTRYDVTSSTNLAVTDPRGGITRYYSSKGQTEAIQDPLVNEVRRTFTKGLLVSSIDANGGVRLMVYDGRGNLTKYTDPLGNVETYAYDANDNLVQKTDALGSVWYYAYDVKNNLIKTTSPMGKITDFTYDAKGNLIGLTDANGKTTIFAYDPFGNITTLTDPTGRTITMGYDLHGLNKTSSTDGKGNITQFQYDGNRRLTKIIHPDGTFKTYGYDACAMTSVTDEKGNVTAFSRDKLLNITGVTDALGKTTRKTYDGNGNLTSRIDALSQVTTNAFDAANRLTRVTDPAGYSISMSYDRNNNLRYLQDERSYETQFNYDANDRLLSVKDPRLATVANTRDALGRISTHTNARGGQTALVYNADRKLTGKSYDGGNVITYGYDPAGNLISVSDPSGTRTFTYDAGNRVTTVQYPDALSLSISYDNAGNIQSMSYPGGVTVNYTYDNRNRVQSVTWGGGNVLSYAYDAVGNIFLESRSNGTTSGYTYNANNRLTGIDHRKTGSPAFALMTYTRDETGRIVGETNDSPLAPALSAMTKTATYNDANQLWSFSENSYLYDTDGNLIAITGNDSFTGVYDAENRLTSSILNGVTTNYTYDGSGNRTKAVQGSQTRNFHYDHLNRLIFETDGNGNIAAYYIYNRQSLTAMRLSSGGSYFYHFDKTGSTVALTNSSGDVVNAYAYEPFGKVSNKTGIVYNPFTYVGAFGVMDEGNGLYFMKHRYYDAVTGKFIQKDPIGFAGGTNLYAYVANDPVSRIDPEGTDIMEGTLNLNTWEPPQYFDKYNDDKKYLTFVYQVGKKSFDMFMRYYPGMPDAAKVTKSSIEITYLIDQGDYLTATKKLLLGVMEAGPTKTAIHAFEDMNDWVRILTEQSILDRFDLKGVDSWGPCGDRGPKY